MVFLLSYEIVISLLMHNKIMIASAQIARISKISKINSFQAGKSISRICHMVCTVKSTVHEHVNM